MEKRMEKTDYKITEFHNSEFGSIRMIEDGGRLLFSGIDVAFALGYAKPRNAINVHCKGALKRGVLTSGGVQPMIFPPFSDLTAVQICNHGNHLLHSLLFLRTQRFKKFFSFWCNQCL